MAGLLVYPRYKIHQLSAEAGGELATSMSEAAQRLRKVILTPSMHIVWAFGLVMVWLNPGLLGQAWFLLKLPLVLTITGLHFWFVRLGRAIDMGTSRMTPRQLRMMNEVPFLVMIGVVLLAVPKPF
ncbi:MAG: CopD family protein [Hyphomonadaceae bacterium]|nr:CopD family protein [Hyphomonadaceae bacterium]